MGRYDILSNTYRHMISPDRKTSSFQNIAGGQQFVPDEKKLKEWIYRAKFGFEMETRIKMTKNIIDSGIPEIAKVHALAEIARHSCYIYDSKGMAILELTAIARGKQEYREKEIDEKTRVAGTTVLDLSLRIKAANEINDLVALEWLATRYTIFEDPVTKIALNKIINRATERIENQNRPLH